MAPPAGYRAGWSAATIPQVSSTAGRRHSTGGGGSLPRYSAPLRCAAAMSGGYGPAAARDTWKAAGGEVLEGTSRSR
ncbi:hypothetical protein GDO81_014477 [Engystomops pustulosus]|uniref:Uncharacterized protein n=1 Tax=Engystomops pustulosus TaxID=76066 RepID=A0AAV7BAQ9_ENGPU|nr:hypothetical protein GDO81_014477 [Engystomops pustulosus]